MKKIVWDPVKANALSRDAARRRVGFDDCVLALAEGRILDDIPNPGSSYPHQRMFVLEIDNYAYVEPYVESEEAIFLKTVFPSRKHTVLYLRGKKS